MTVREGRLDFAPHPPDAWHGFIDEDGYFHGQSAYGARDFKLSDGIMVPGVVGHGIDQSCQYIYRFKPIREAADTHP